MRVPWNVSAGRSSRSAKPAALPAGVSIDRLLPDTRGALPPGIEREGHRPLARHPSGPRLEHALQVMQGKAVRMHLLEWVFVRFDELHRDGEGIEVRIFDAPDGQFLAKDATEPLFQGAPESESQKSDTARACC